MIFYRVERRKPYATEEEVPVTRFADYVDSAGVRTAAEQRYRQLAPRAKRSVRQAADAVAPYAGSARDAAAHYADEARLRLAPRVSLAVEQARETVPPRVEQAVETAAKRTRSTVRQAADYAVPRVGQAVGSARAAAEPMREEAAARGAAAVAALRGHVTAADIERAVRRHARRERRGRMAKRVVVAGLLAAGGFAAWKWWSRQTNPEWLVEAADATEVTDGHSSTPRTFQSVDGTGELDPEVEAKQAEAEQAERSPHRKTDPPA
jgi:Family of unknown function (DUF5324)